MSSIAEKARMEADEVEREEEEALEAESEHAEPEPGDGDGEQEAEASISQEAIRKAERAIEAQRRKLAGIIGDAAVAQECPLCTAVGFLPELPPVGAMLTVVQDGDGIALDFSAPGDLSQFPQAPDKGPCPECAATGQVQTGSKNPHAMIAPCSKCSGNGWVMIARPTPGMTIPPPTTGPGGVVVPDGAASVPADAWDRPFGHPHYGLPPSMVGV